jgi:hypothetical protein
MEIAALRTAPKQYETLRKAAFGEAVPIETRNGLALFLRRGMWGWAQAAAVLNTSAGSACRSARPDIEPDQRNVIELFAAMAMSASNRRTHECIAKSTIAPS